MQSGVLSLLERYRKQITGHKVRITYILLSQETANAINQKKIESNVISMSRIRPKDHNVLFRAKMYGPTGFQQLPDDPQVDGRFLFETNLRYITYIKIF